MVEPVYQAAVDRLRLSVFQTREEMGNYAAREMAECMKAVLKEKNRLRIIFAAAPSQNEFLKALTQMEDIPWERVDAFHMDEYIGLDKEARQRFSAFLNQAVFDIVHPGSVNLLMPDSENPEEECERYSRLLEDEIDIICLGIGENGHIAFNDPPVADFYDTKKVKVVKLDQVCRQQQVNDGCFERLEDVPSHAVTLTIPTLMSGRHLFAIVPGENKKEALQNALTGAISEKCPASVLRTHGDCRLYAEFGSYPAARG